MRSVRCIFLLICFVTDLTHASLFLSVRASETPAKKKWYTHYNGKKPALSSDISSQWSPGEDTSSDPSQFNWYLSEKFSGNVAVGQGMLLYSKGFLSGKPADKVKFPDGTQVFVVAIRPRGGQIFYGFRAMGEEERPELYWISGYYLRRERKAPP